MCDIHNCSYINMYFGSRETLSQQTFTCLKSTAETLENDLKYVQG